MAVLTMDLGVERLLQSSEPLIRLRALTDLVRADPDDPGVRNARAGVAKGSIVRALLTDTAPRHPYSKWIGAHWRLVSLVDLGIPPDVPGIRRRLDEDLDAVLRWLAGPADKPRPLKGPVIRGLHRRCASQEGNGLFVAVHLGRADDPRSKLLVESLLDWQWPDGGWNCDRHPEAHHSSANETFAPLRGLAAFARETSDRAAAAAARAAADRTAEFFLRHRVAFSERTGEPMNPRVVALHYPPYWHYDVVVGLRSLVESGHIADRRTADALDLLEARRREDGLWEADASWYGRPGSRGRLLEIADWTGGPPRGRSEALSLSALRVLKAAGRLG